MEDGLERNFTWIKIQHHHSNLSKEKEDINNDCREKKAFEQEEQDNKTCIKQAIRNIKKNKID